MERILIAGAIAVLMAWPTESGARAWQERSTKTIPASGVRALRVENARGVIALRPSSDAQIHLEALKVVRSNDEEWADRVSRETEVTVRVEAGNLIVRVNYPQRQTVNVRFWDLFSDFDMPRVEVRLALEVPPNLPVHLKSSSGDLETTDLLGPQVLETTSGDIDVVAGSRVRAASTSGDLRMERVGRSVFRTVSGDAEIHGPLGSVRGESSSGDLVVRGARDSVRLRTVSGDILVEGAPEGAVLGSTSGTVTVRDAAGTVDIETANGDIATQLEPPLERADIESNSGSVVVELSPDLGCRLDIQSTHGEIELELPLDLRDVTRHRVTASVRKGTAPVVLRSTSGDITVSEASR